VRGGHAPKRAISRGGGTRSAAAKAKARPPALQAEFRRLESRWKQLLPKLKGLNGKK